jgi:vacuolar-type H+-ATPase subunit I/STV1
MGWIPANTFLLTGEHGVFSRGIGHVYLAISIVMVLVRLLRVRALVIDNERSHLVVELADRGIRVAAVVGFVALVVGLFSLFAHVWRGAGEAIGSYFTSAAIGVAVVGGVFVGSYVTHKMGGRITAEDDTPNGYVQRAFGILIGLPLAALFGFLLSLLIIFVLERTGINVEPLREFFNSQATMSIALTTGTFLALCLVVHVSRAALRPQSPPVFFATMLGTGLVIIVSKFALILLVGFGGR